MLAEVNGVELAFSDTGAGSPVVLLVHGFPLNRSMWDPQLGVLRTRARVIAPDLRGFGASEAGPPGPLTMDQHADDLAGLLDHLGIDESVIYCGLSMGGYVAFSFWRRHRRRVRGLVLADTKATADTPEARDARLAMAEQAEALASPQPAIDGLLGRMFSPSLPAGAMPEQLVRAMMASTAPRTIANAQRGMAIRLDSMGILASIQVPVLVLVGADDGITPPSDAERMVDSLPNARLEVIRQAGHMANLENPDEFNAALTRFIGVGG